MRLALIMVLSAGLATGCDTWSGPQGGGETSGGTMSDASRDRDATPRGDSTVPSGEAGPDGGATLGDEGAGYVRCGRVSCAKSQPCCTTNTLSVLSECAADCGATEATITCDGPEDCSAGQVCCHRFGATGLTTECLGAPASPPGDASVSADASAPADASPPDAGEAALLCATLPGENHIACHTDRDCGGSGNAPLCRADGSRRDFLGYCIADPDDPSTPGHDEPGLLSCGDPDHDGTAVTCLNTDICCLSRVDATAAGCTAKGRCGFSEVQIVCDGPEDCAAAGQACCFMPESSKADGGTEPGSSTCAAECAEGAIKRCHRDVDCGGAAGSCKPDAQSAWWGTCQT